MVQSLILDTSRVRTSTETFYDHLRRNAQEVEQLRAELAVAQGLALRDPLTGLLNRRGFDQHLQRASAVPCGESCLLIVDIDQFKAINDAHGHMLGDKVIIAVARALHTCAGTRGPTARIGGEEFSAVLLDTAGEGGPGHRAEQVQRRGRALAASAARKAARASAGSPSRSALPARAKASRSSR